LRQPALSRPAKAAAAKRVIEWPPPELRRESAAPAATLDLSGLTDLLKRTGQAIGGNGAFEMLRQEPCRSPYGAATAGLVQRAAGVSPSG
jgi:hypothetical protein